MADATRNDYIDALNEIALDLYWSWSHASDEIWKRLDPVLWDLTHNPLVVLRTVSNDKIHQVLDEPSVRAYVDEYVQYKQRALSAPAWFQKTYSDSDLRLVAYFSMEFMLSEALPIYSGGLGNVAGDHLKSASDLGVPIIGVGLLFQQGYSRQTVNPDGSQQDYFPYNDPWQLPVTPLRMPDGQWLRIKIKLPGYPLWLRTWKVQVGRVTLLLLDSNDPANYPAHRCITSELYGSGADLRLMQEMVLGIGGWRLLKALNLRPQVCHLNEGHCAFAVLERAADFMEENNQPFDVALAVTRAGNVFTTHTAIGAGFDRFSPEIMAKYMGWYAAERLQVPLEDLLAMGRVNGNDLTEGFNMTYLAIRGSGLVNGVSRLHQRVSQQLFSVLFPRWPLDEVPVSYVTNGVHMPSWDSPAADSLWTRYCGKDRWLGTTENLEVAMMQVSDTDIWGLHTANQEAFISYIRRRYARQLAVQGMPNEVVEAARYLFDPGALTIGFARRFVAYKRPNLLLHDPQRLYHLLTDPKMPVQLVLAGKAHPEDAEGQKMIKDWFEFIRKYDLSNHVVFLGDYDMILTSFMVQGVDLWLNTPRRPWEACGTSGMKALVNGAINLSVADGWWAEAFRPEAGWTFGDEGDLPNTGLQDALDGDRLYDLLEHEVIPEFYDRASDGIPKAWVTRMRNSMAKLTPRFSANRSLREYTEGAYLPAMLRLKERSEGGGEAGRKMLDLQFRFKRIWNAVRFENIVITKTKTGTLFTVVVHLSEISPEEVTMQLYSEATGERGKEVHEMKLAQITDSTGGIYMYELCLATNRPGTDYTPRILPVLTGLSAPLECSLILWQR